MNVIRLNGKLQNVPTPLGALVLDQLVQGRSDWFDQNPLTPLGTPDQVVHNQVDTVFVPLVLHSVELYYTATRKSTLVLKQRLKPVREARLTAATKAARLAADYFLSPTMKLDWYTRRLFKLWLPAVIGMVVLVLAALYGGHGVRFLLFTHHWFYFIAAILLFNPVVQTFWPSSDVKLKRQLSAQRKIQARQQVDNQRLPSSRNTPGTSETAAERLVQLRQEKVALDKQIGSLATKRKEGSR